MSESKPRRSAAYVQSEKRLHSWILRQTREYGKTFIYARELREKMKQLVKKEHRQSDFKASYSWLKGFISRHDDLACTQRPISNLIQIYLINQSQNEEVNEENLCSNQSEQETSESESSRYETSEQSSQPFLPQIQMKTNLCCSTSFSIGDHLTNNLENNTMLAYVRRIKSFV